MEPPFDGTPAGNGVAGGAGPGAQPGTGRQRSRTPVVERSQRMHRFSGTLLAALDDATAGGVDNVAVGCLSPREAGETVLELREVIARLKGLELAVLAHADARGVHGATEGPVTADTAAWLAYAGLTDPGAARREVRLSAALTGDCAATGSALLAGDVDAAQLRRLGRRLLAVIDPDGAEAAEARRLQAEEDDAARCTSFSTWDDRHGTTHLFAKLPTRHGQMLRKVIEAIANPQLPDAIDRSPAQTQSDAETATREVDGSGASSPTSMRPVPEVLGEAFCRLIETPTLASSPPAVE